MNKITKGLLAASIMWNAVFFVVLLYSLTLHDHTMERGAQVGMHGALLLVSWIFWNMEE